MQQYLNDKRNRNNPCLQDIRRSLIGKNKSCESTKKIEQQPIYIKYKKYNDSIDHESPFNITKKEICNKKKKFTSESGFCYDFETLFADIYQSRKTAVISEK